jgi:predicted DNA-binding protein
MADTEYFDRYNRQRRTLGVRMPDPEVLDAVVAASTEAGMTKADWVRSAIAEKLERDKKD